jgi:hypothetical protein
MSQLGISFVVAEYPIQFSDPEEGRSGGRITCRRIGRVEDNPERHSHVGLLVFATNLGDGAGLASRTQKGQ